MVGTVDYQAITAVLTFATVLGILRMEVLIMGMDIHLDGKATKENITTAVGGTLDFQVNTMENTFIMALGIQHIGIQDLEVQDITPEEQQLIKKVQNVEVNYIEDCCGYALHK